MASLQAERDIPPVSTMKEGERAVNTNDTENEIPIFSEDETSNPSASEPSQEDIEAQPAALEKSTTVQSQKPYTAFSPGAKWFIVTMTAMASFFSPLSSQIYFPVLPILTDAYHLSSGLINVSITTYLIFQGLAPSFMGTFSDGSGRRPGYIIAFAIYTGANIGL